MVKFPINEEANKKHQQSSELASIQPQGIKYPCSYSVDLFFWWSLLFFLCFVVVELCLLLASNSPRNWGGDSLSAHHTFVVRRGIVANLGGTTYLTRIHLQVPPKLLFFNAFDEQFNQFYPVSWQIPTR